MEILEQQNQLIEQLKNDCRGTKVFKFHRFNYNHTNFPVEENIIRTVDLIG